MTGERFLWYKIAARLGMAPQRCMASHTVDDFIDWGTFFEMEAQSPTVDQWYMAQIAFEVVRTRYKTDNISIKNFILKIVSYVKGKDAAVSREEMIARDKAAWFMALGVTLPGAPTADAPPPQPPP